ncbi:MAG: hypothetical protein MK135_17310, partial [Polyangiaceae bacterium]|nr:hypothetical protein [Polyangiaceae bacterium]
FGEDPVLLGRREKDQHLIFARFRSAQPEDYLLEDLSVNLSMPRLQQGSEVQLSSELEHGIILLTLDGRYLTILISPRGEILAVNKMPENATQVAIAGLKVAALDEHHQRFWESLDGGLSFRSSVLPRSLCAVDAPACEVPFVCADAGCLIGTELARLGWGAPLSERPWSTEEKSVNEHISESGPALVCSPIGASQQLGEVEGLPSSSDAGWGRLAFQQLSVDSRTGEVKRFFARRESTQIESQVILNGLESPEEFAQVVVPQVEGSALLRYRLPSKGRQAIDRVTIAFDNRAKDLSVKQQVPRRFQLARGAHRRRRGQVGLARPEILSVAADGLVVRLKTNPPEPGIFFAQGKKPIELMRTHWPAAVRNQLSEGRAHEEYIEIGNDLVPIVLDSHDKILTLPQRSQAPGRFLSYALAMPPSVLPPIQSGYRIAYRGDEVGFLSQFLGPAQETSRSFWVRPSSEGQFSLPLATPQQSNLSERPYHCSATQMQSTPRVIASATLTSAREVRIRDPLGEERLLTSDAILYGSPTEACLAAWEAKGVIENLKEGRRRAHALIYPGEVSWLFEAHRSEGQFQLRARPLRCEYQ